MHLTCNSMHPDSKKWCHRPCSCTHKPRLLRSQHIKLNILHVWRIECLKVLLVMDEGFSFCLLTTSQIVEIWFDSIWLINFVEFNKLAFFCIQLISFIFWTKFVKISYIVSDCLILLYLLGFRRCVIFYILVHHIYTLSLTSLEWRTRLFSFV